MKIKIVILTTALIVTAISAHIEPGVEAAESEYVLPAALTADDIPGDINAQSMARLPQVQRQGLDAVGQDAFDTYVSPGTGYGSGLRGPIGMWMNSPELAKAMFGVRQRVRYGSTKDQRLTELTIISTAREINNQYEYSAHEPLAKTAGLEQEIIDIVRFRKELDDSIRIDGFGDQERLIIQFTRELISADKVSSETFSQAINLFGNGGVMDLTGLIGYYSFVAITLKAFDVQRPVGSDLLLPIRND
jgi:4-carboxymuconolactone decarboxylase